jgi:hypothetical protein
VQLRRVLKADPDNADAARALFIAQDKVAKERSDAGKSNQPRWIEPATHPDDIHECRAGARRAGALSSR